MKRGNEVTTLEQQSETVKSFRFCLEVLNTSTESINIKNISINQ